jgi:hypothetical protein
MQAADAEQIADLQADVSTARAAEIITEYRNHRTLGWVLTDAQRKEFRQSLSIKWQVRMDRLVRYGATAPTFKAPSRAACGVQPTICGHRHSAHLPPVALPLDVIAATGL